jgi:MSHA pilin protein MshA
MVKQQSGFTLIELVLVIVILGILAAAALPRFSDLSTQARLAAVNGLAGSVRGAAAVAHSTQLARGLASNASGVSIDGATVDFSGGYPTTATIDDMLSDFTGFTFNGAGTFTATTNCTVAYAASVGGAFPVVTITSSGC